MASDTATKAGIYAQRLLDNEYLQRKVLGNSEMDREAQAPASAGSEVPAVA